MFPFQIYNEHFREMMTEDQVLTMVAKSQEFDQIKVSTAWLLCAEAPMYIVTSCPVPISILVFKQNQEWK